jgi:hypothetical protein
MVRPYFRFNSGTVFADHASVADMSRFLTAYFPVVFIKKGSLMRRVNRWRAVIGLVLAALWWVGAGQAVACEGGDGGEGNSIGNNSSGGGSGGGSVFSGMSREDIEKIFGRPPGGWPTSGNGPMVRVVPNPQAPELTRENIIKLKKAFGPGVVTQRERELATRQMFDQWDADKNLTDAAVADGYHDIAKGVGYGATVAGGVVATVASGGAAGPTVATISVIGDGIAAGAGSAAEDLSKGKSLPEALKNAVGPTVAKTVTSYTLGKIETGSKVANGVIGTAGGLTYDEIRSGAPNTAPPAPTIYAPSGGGFTGTGVDVAGKHM